MRFVITFWIDDVQKVKLFKDLETARTFLKKARHEHPEYKNLKLKVIKFLK